MRIKIGPNGNDFKVYLNGVQGNIGQKLNCTKIEIEQLPNEPTKAVLTCEHVLVEAELLKEHCKIETIDNA